MGLSLFARIMLSFLVALILILGLGTLDLISTMRLTECFRSLELSKNRVILLEETASILKDIQRAHRGFVATRDKRFLDPYYNSLELVPSVKGRLLASDEWEKNELPNIQNLINLIDATVDHADDALVRTLSFQEDSVRRRIFMGKRLVDSANFHIARLKRMELLRQERIEEDVQRWITTNRSTIYSSISVFTVLLTIGLLQLRRTMKDKRRLYRELKAKNEEIVRSNGELSTLNEELHTSNDQLNESFVRLELAHEMLTFREKELHQAQVISRTGSFRFNTTSGEFQYSPMFARIMNFEEKQELQFTDFLKRIDVDDREQFEARLQIDPPDGEILFDEFQISSEGEIRFIRSARQSLYEHGEKILLGAVTDITDIKRTSTELESVNRKLQQSNTDLEAFTYSISHDLKAPLRTVLMYGHLLMDKQRDSRTADEHKWLEVILRKGKQMNELIDGLLALSTYGSAALQKVEVDVAQMVKEISEELVSGYPRASLSLETPLGRVHADEALLHQVWVNLISNAFKFSSTRESPVITIRRDDRDGFATFTVADNGVGFDKAKGEELFGVFRRFHSADQFSGSGVGLAIVKRIINSHGGDVCAEGENDNGAAFSFTLPL